MNGEALHAPCAVKTWHAVQTCYVPDFPDFACSVLCLHSLFNAWRSEPMLGRILLLSAYYNSDVPLC